MDDNYEYVVATVDVKKIRSGCLFAPNVSRLNWLKIMLGPWDTLINQMTVSDVMAQKSVIDVVALVIYFLISIG